MKISVALCTYNGEKFLSAQLTSILHQSLTVDEIVVCDDGSSDSTLKILQSLAVPESLKFKIFSNGKNLGVTKNFEKAVSLCGGDIIFLADQDDVWEQNKVEVTVRFFAENPSCFAVFSDASLIDEKSKSIDRTLWEFLQFDEALSINPPQDIFEFLLLYRNVVTGACLAIRKESLELVLPFPHDGKMLHDQWIGLKLGAINKIGIIKERLVRYRLHPGQETKDIWQNSHGMSREVRSSIIADDATAFPFEYYKYWKKKLAILLLMKESGIYINDSIFKNVRVKIKNGMQAYLKSLPFLKRKSNQLKFFLKKEEAVSLVDLLKF